MALYAIGDIQGCFDQLLALLDKLRFDAGRDRLWFVGDLVNRGPKSLQTLRYLRELDVVTVLGNHDLHLLASAQIPALRKRRDTLQEIFEADDSEELLDWLRTRPLLHHDPDSGYTLIHAGLPPQWDLATAQACAAEVEAVLRGDGYRDFLANMYGNQPDLWRDDLKGIDRLRFTTNCLTRLRYCDRHGRLALDEKGPPGSQPTHLKPWFDWPQRNSRDLNLLFGHWSTLGPYEAPGIHALDTGCLWGGELTALRIDCEPPRRITLDCPMVKTPSPQKDV